MLMIPRHIVISLHLLILIHYVQQDLNSLLDWCSTWLSSLNFTNCKTYEHWPNQYYFYLDNEAHQICAVQEERKTWVSPLMNTDTLRQTNNT